MEDNMNLLAAKTKMDTFKCSDIAASLLSPNYRVRWGQSGTGLTLLVKEDSTPSHSVWALVYCPDESAIVVDTSTNKFSLPPEALPKIAFHEVGPTEHLPAILERCQSDFFKQIPPPRFNNDEILVTEEQANAWEQDFYNTLIAPHLLNSKIYAIAHSGTELAKRLGIEAQPIFVRHYEETTFQNDDEVEDVFSIPMPDNHDQQVLIIDDMVSSGRTAAAVLKQFHEAGYTKVRFVVPFCVLASNELPEILNEVEYYKIISNFYWVYGRGMDLYSHSTRTLKQYYGAEKQFEDFNSKENIDDLRSFFHI